MLQDVFAEMYRNMIAHYRLSDEQSARMLKMILANLPPPQAPRLRREPAEEGETKGGVLH